MVTNEEIMDTLKVILEKVERLENLKAGNISIGSGTISIQQAGSGSISIEEASSVDVSVGPNCPIGLSFEETDTFTLNAPSAAELSVSCEGDIGDFAVSAQQALKGISIECEGDIQGDVHGDVNCNGDIQGDVHGDVECDGDIQGDVHGDVECDGDIEGDVHGDVECNGDINGDVEND